jgi:beta-galactosidase
MYLSIPAWAARGAHKPYFVNELQTHTQSALTPGSEVTPEEIRNWILMCVFTGASGIQLWRWRPFLHGYQVTGRGLTQTDGTPNERSEAVEDVLKVIHDNPIFDDFTVANPFVKIAFSYDTRLYFDALLKWRNSFWAEDLEGWYRLFWENGVTAGFADLSRLEDEDVPVLVLPALLRISGEEAEVLREYVQNGGFLIGDGRLGAINEKAEAPAEGVPGHALSELFGFKELDVSGGDNFLNQKLALNGGRALMFMEDGSPSVVLNHFGNGRTLYFNSFVGIGMKKEIDRKIEDLIFGQLGELIPVIATKNSGVHLSFIEGKSGKKAMLAINFSDEDQAVTVGGSGLKSIRFNLAANDYNIREV